MKLIPKTSFYMTFLTNFSEK
uniref:Uncharacterized protein n=1 Tax=Rhizophora mucronata TaxID=61149 RepID=A0A2P2N9S1_RHIMU